MDTKEAGRKGGLSKSPKKQAAARANGARHGARRPVAPAASPATRLLLVSKASE